jgi:hypothetical protein
VIVSTAAAGTTAASTLPGKVIGRGSASGQFAIASAHGTVKKPRALYLRLVGKIDSGTAIVGCSKGFSVSANDYNRNKAGLYRLPIKPARADSCDLTASAGGSGRVVVELRAVK